MEHEEKKEHNKKINKHFTNNNMIFIAILLAAIIIGAAIIISKKGIDKTKKKSIISELKINEKAYSSCFTEKRYESKIREDIESSKRATAHISPEQGVGTPYSVLVHKNGSKFEVAGAYPTEAIKGIIDGMLTGTAKNQTEINIDPITDKDHYFGSKEAEIVIIEYSDLECPYCARFHQTVHDLVKQYNGKVGWVYRHLPLESLHKNAMNKALASECVNELGGNDAFWKYLDSTFQKIQPKTPVFDPLTGETVTE